MSPRFRHPRRSAAIAAHVAVYVAFTLICCAGWGVVLLLWQLMLLAVAYPDLAVLSAAALVVGYATHQSWRQARQLESLETESTRSEW